MTDENREEAYEAREHVRNIIAHLFPNDIMAFKPSVLDMASKMVIDRDTRIRAEAARKELKRFIAAVNEIVESNGNADQSQPYVRGYLQAFEDVLNNLATESQSNAQKAADYRAYKWRHEMIGDGESKTCAHPRKFTYNSGPVIGAIFCPDCFSWLNANGSVFMSAPENMRKGEPRTCKTCLSNHGPDINADDSACVECAKRDEEMLGDALTVYMENLLPCPFCGSTRLHVYRNAQSSDCETTLDNVACLACGAGQPTIKRWNTRANQANVRLTLFGISESASENED